MVTSFANANLALVQNSTIEAAVSSSTSNTVEFYVGVTSNIEHSFAFTSNAGDLSSIGASEYYADGLDWRHVIIGG